MKTRRTFWTVTGMILLITCLSLAETPVYGGGKKKMEPLYDLNTAQKLAPNVFKMSEQIYFLFPVLKDGTQYAATNSLNNAVSILNIQGDRIKVEEHFRNAYESVDLSPTVIPPIEDGVFGFGQIRGFAMFDLKKKKFKDFRVCPSLNDTILQIAVADVRKRHFIFSVERYPNNPTSAFDTTAIIRLLDLSGDEPKLIKEMEQGNDHLWELQDNKFFIYSGKNRTMKVFTPQLEPSHHPLVDVFKRYKDKLHILDVKIHPTLPFALITDRKNPGYILAWGDRINVNLIPIANDADWFEFSPDGKWVIFRGRQAGETRTFIMPISEKYPYYVGTPILLFDHKFDKYAKIWTTNPVSFVGSYSKNLYRWELTNEAQKTSGYPTFHDYIVTKDLEKLTKEKKQGLGK